MHLFNLYIKCIQLCKVLIQECMFMFKGCHRCQHRVYRCHRSSHWQTLSTHTKICLSKVSHFLEYQGVRRQFNGTADHVYFSALQGVMGQGTNTVGSGDSHNAGLVGQGQGTISQGSTDMIIPSLQTLKNSAEINRKVSQRYQELEDSAQLKQGSLDVLLQSISQRIKKVKG